MAATTTRRIDRQRIKELTDREEARLNERTPRSHKMYERAVAEFDDPELEEHLAMAERAE